MILCSVVCPVVCSGCVTFEVLCVSCFLGDNQSRLRKLGFEARFGLNYKKVSRFVSSVGEKAFEFKNLTLFY